MRLAAALVALLAVTASAKAGEDDVSAAIERQLRRAIARAAPSVVRLEVTRVPVPEAPLPPAPATPAPPPEAPVPNPEGKAPAPRPRPSPGGPRFPDGATPPEYFRRPPGPAVAVVVDPEGGLVTSLWNVSDDPVPEVPSPAPSPAAPPAPAPTAVTGIQVLLPDGRSLPARVVGTDPNDDLAYLKIEAVGLVALPLAAQDPRVGDLVAVVSRAPGTGTPAATLGNVSASGRLRQTAPLEEGGARSGTALQLSARLNYGNSGGAVVNLRGELVGLAGHVTHVATDPDARKGQSSGVGFATPASRLRVLLPRLRAGESIPRRATPYLGVRMGPAPSGEGAALVEVVGGSPAEKAGLRRDDVVLVAGETRVESSLDLRWAIQQGDVGESLRLVVIRGEERLEVTVTLGARPDGRRR
ncbi:MAG: S1C family serine protease [Planctomycetales bacterium]|nr:S1C family serine protease [Planctomycetales bacterium]